MALSCVICIENWKGRYGRSLMSKYTEFTLKDLRKQGYLVWMVERYNQFTQKRTDLYNFIDILAIMKDEIAGVQSCGQDFKAHERAGGTIYLYGWRKLLKKRGGKQKIWVPRIKEFILDDFKVPRANHPPLCSYCLSFHGSEVSCAESIKS
jgi:hypothetical protein